MKDRDVSTLNRYPTYAVNIGIEVHVQLTTNSKIFCSCKNGVAQEPNSQLCHICAGYPGVLPVLNKDVVQKAIAAGLATNCTIAPRSYFARKHYFYPDLPKNYQITQADHPICSQGFVEIKTEDGSTKKIRILRIHIEEDAGKNMHSPYSQESFVDLNRTGTPLLEIVTYPDIASSYEAKEYLKTLRTLVQYIGICTGNMEEGAFRGDTNISVRKKDATKLGTKCELKNINSFKFIGDAIEYEIERQIELIEAGGSVRQETRLWDEKNGRTIVMRSKEEAADYRYLDDPDLPILDVASSWIDAVKVTLPELPHQKQKRFIDVLGLTPYEADILVHDKALADYFEKAYALHPTKTIVNWILRDVCGLLKEHKIEIEACRVTPEALASIVKMLDENKINNHAAKEVFEEVAQSGKDPIALVKERGLEQIGSVDELEKIVIELIQQNPALVEDYKAGKERVFGFFIGQAMQKTKGKGNPKILQDLFKKHMS